VRSNLRSRGSIGVSDEVKRRVIAAPRWRVDSCHLPWRLAAVRMRAARPIPAVRVGCCLDEEIADRAERDNVIFSTGPIRTAVGVRRDVACETHVRRHAVGDSGIRSGRAVTDPFSAAFGHVAAGRTRFNEGDARERGGRRGRDEGDARRGGRWFGFTFCRGYFSDRLLARRLDDGAI
jgi:hypothetical protein